MGSDITSSPCDRWQEAISALVDGEDAPTVPTLVEAHLRRCPRCRTYRDRITQLDHQLRSASTERQPDQANEIIRRLRAADQTTTRWTLRCSLVVVAAQILYLALPMVWSTADGHEGRHVFSFTVTYSMALLLVAWRPGRARTVLPIAGALSASLAMTAVLDVARHATSWPVEITHLPEVVSLALVWLLARPPGLAGVEPEGRADVVTVDVPDGGHAGRHHRPRSA